MAIAVWSFLRGRSLDFGIDILLAHLGLEQLRPVALAPAVKLFAGRIIGQAREDGKQSSILHSLSYFLQRYTLFLKFPTFLRFSFVVSKRMLTFATICGLNAGQNRWDYVLGAFAQRACGQ